MGLRKLWAVVGIGRIEDGSRDLRLLEDRGIRLECREILGVDPANRSVSTDLGSLAADYLVVALGAEPRPDLVPGLSEHGHNVWDVVGVPGLKASLESFGGGSIVIAIAGMPYTCPPAPFECAMLLDDHLRERGLRDRCSITITTPKPILLPNAGLEGSAWLAEQLAEKGIGYETGREVKRVDAGRIEYADAALDFDLLVGVPPHRPPDVVAESDLAGPGGWVAVDPTTLETGHENVFAIGDVTKITLANGLPLPKAGVMADLEGRRVAAAIAARIAGGDRPDPFNGRGYCFLEMSKSTAAFIEGDFYARPEPRVSVDGESEAHADRKHRFEAERLELWFGS
jgi:sulfide:quinone oxidoreductase